MDLFEKKSISPMLIGADSEPFDSPEYLFELKLDGDRCVAFLDPENGVDLRNKRDDKMLYKLPELSEIHKQVKKRCILDGELIVIKDGVPDFFEIQRRVLMRNAFKIELAMKKLPATFTAFDILYCDGEDLTRRPLEERREILQKTVRENDRLAVTRHVEEQGTTLYELAKEKNLEGVVAKKRGSLYAQGKRTRDWIKIKYMLDDDFVVCGYIEKEQNITSIVLGQYRGGELVYKGHVTLGMNREDFAVIMAHEQGPNPFLEVPKGNETAVWLRPDLVCCVKYLMLTAHGSLRHAVWKGLRQDKKPVECIEKETL